MREGGLGALRLESVHNHREEDGMKGHGSPSGSGIPMSASRAHGRAEAAQQAADFLIGNVWEGDRRYPPTGRA